MSPVANENGTVRDFIPKYVYGRREPQTPVPLLVDMDDARLNSKCFVHAFALPIIPVNTSAETAAAVAVEEEEEESRE
jgi:hypothetical protein